MDSYFTSLDNYQQSTATKSIKDIKCSGNWMWAYDNNENKYLLYRAVCYLNKLLLNLFLLTLPPLV